jgi:choline-sulfatase
LVVLGVVFHRVFPASEAVVVQGSPQGPKHVLLVSVDTLRPDFLSIYNPKARRTPHIDRLAASAMVFEQARTESPWTKPSLCTLHTGLPPATHRVTQRFDVLHDKFDTLAERFAAAGYHTGFIGRNHFLRSGTNLDQGFVDYAAYPRRGYGPSLGAELATALALVPEDSPTSSELTDQARHWLRQRAGAPFFLWLHYFDPHLPYTPPSRYLPAAAKDETRLRSFDDVRGVRTGHYRLDASLREQIRDLYAAEVQYVDAEVGRLLAELETLGLYDDMLIVFVSDHGEEFWEHQGFEHGHTLYDELLRVPLLVKLPKSERVGRETARVSVAQVYPTMLAAAGLSAVGSDRLPRKAGLVTQGPLVDRDVSFVAQSPMYYDDKLSVMRNGRKLIRSLSDGGELLFDLDSDPGEQRPILDETGVLRRELDAALQQQQRAAELGATTLGVQARPAQDKRSSDRDTLRDLRALGYVQ